MLSYVRLDGATERHAGASCAAASFPFTCSAGVGLCCALLVPSSRCLQSGRPAPRLPRMSHRSFLNPLPFPCPMLQVADLRRGPRAAGGEYAVLKKRRSYEVRSYPGPPAGAVPGGASASGKGSAAAHVSGTGGGPAVFAVGSFGGEAGPRQAEAAVQQLRQALAADGLQPASGDWLLLAATADDAGSPLLRRNEVLVQLQGFQLW